jgi:hypothetical protein
MSPAQDFEKLGQFYLGRRYELAEARTTDELVLYDAKDLVTHAVCVGMTGSGKTGLCVGLIEEAAIDGIPAIVIDPKGDLSNLLLTFPELRAADFEPWINADDARRKGMSTTEFATQQAQMWAKGLAEWGQDGGRIARLREAAEFTVYTPGSTAGVPVSIISSFTAPPPAVRDDAELLSERVSTTVTSLLGLMGIDADPIQSREHILISTILAEAWKDGRDIDLGGLIGQIQSPPVERIGVMSLESFFPAKERFELAMRLNNLLAAPGFASWLRGEPLEVGSILHTPAGKPRVAIFSIAHLSDAERMFFVSMLLNQVLSWMRTQPGTTSLRALVYMDEIFGYFPPVANPPSKRPLLTLLKQARAFGVGVVLATQNPVDLDYKGLANTGTWFIGRLQTERDKARVLEGLEGASAGSAGGFDRGRMDELLAGLGSRVFLLHNVHEDEPVLFQTRWVMSYLRGPLTREQIKRLPKAEDVSPREKEARGTAARLPHVISDTSTSRPVLPPDVPQVFIPVRSLAPQGASLVYQPMLAGAARVLFDDRKADVHVEQDVALLAPIGSDWREAQEVEVPPSDWESSPQPQASFTAVPADAALARSYTAWSKSLADHVYRTRSLSIFHSDELKQSSRPGESERDFRIRLAQAAREARDEEVEALRGKYASKRATLEDRLRRANQAVERESEQARQSKVQTGISFATTLLGAFLGRKKLSAGTIGRATTAARGVGRSSKEAQDVERAEETVAAVLQKQADLEAQFQADADRIAERFDPARQPLVTLALRPEKSDISVRTVALAWVPFWRQADGPLTAAS